MTSGQNKTNNKSDDQLLIMQATFEDNRKYYDEKIKNITEYLTAMITSMIVQIKISKSSPEKSIYQRLNILIPWSRLTRRRHHWKVYITHNLVTCGLSNIRSAHQSHMNVSSIHNSKATQLWTSRNSASTSICVSMQWLSLYCNYPTYQGKCPLHYN